ncbi:MAG: hypothetical protein KDB23_23935 [Planctomycetales bacterium]|nr:hypothetical protein [Planctomycetales bacterium]
MKNLVTRGELLRRGGLGLLGIALSVLASGRALAHDRGKAVRLIPNETTKTYDFDTDHVAGSIRADGAYHGVSRLVHKASGIQVIDPRYSALNIFRLFSVNLGLGTPRHWTREIRATETSVEIRWAATDAHQGTILARYEVREPGDVDLTVTLESLGTYSGYELLLPSYFDPSMIPHVYLKRRAVGATPPDIDLVVPRFSEVFRGCSLVFPRDAHTARFPLDGRWNRSEYKMSVAPFFPVRHYGYPFMFVTDRDKTIAAVMMMRRDDCSAISSRYYSERIEERAASYSAMDFLVFGRDVLPGNVLTARVRLSLTSLDTELSQPLKLHQQFLGETSVTAEKRSE